MKFYILSEYTICTAVQFIICTILHTFFVVKYLYLCNVCHNVLDDISIFNTEIQKKTSGLKDSSLVFRTQI